MSGDMENVQSVSFLKSVKYNRTSMRCCMGHLYFSLHPLNHCICDIRAQQGVKRARVRGASTESRATFDFIHRTTTQLPQKKALFDEKSRHLLKMYSIGQPRCRWVYFKKDLAKFCITVQYITRCLAVDPLQWMGAIGIRVQTADKIITIIHTTVSSPSVNVFWS